MFALIIRLQYRSRGRYLRTHSRADQPFNNEEVKEINYQFKNENDEIDQIL